MPGAALSPLIVESKFKQARAEDMKKKEAEVDGERLEFIPLQAGDYKLPPVSLLDYDDNQESSVDRASMLEMSARLTQTLENYGVKGEVAAIRPGPVVTMFEFAPAPGTRLNKIVNLADDLAMSLEALKVRIVAPIPGKAAVGIEVPNRGRETVYLKEIIADETFRNPQIQAPHGARQRHRRGAADRRPRQNAPPSGRRHHRLGQVRRRQLDDNEPSLFIDPRRCADDHGRSQDARALHL